MIYHNKNLCKVRTVTTFLTLQKDKTTWKKEIVKASTFCNDLSLEFLQNGYEVQSIRIVTNAFGEYLDTSSLEKAKEDNPTIGIILCSDKDNTVVKYSSINDKENLFVSKYQLYLPTEEELKAEIEKDIFELGLRVEDDR